jgi:hypothetical protein
MINAIEAILKGLAMGLLLVISVGPVIFTVIKQSINNGRGGGFSFVVGVWISDFLLVILSNLFSELVTTIMDFKMQIGIAGSTFLIGMGIFYIFFKKVHLHPEDISLPPLRSSDHAKIVFIPAKGCNIFITYTEIIFSHRIEHIDSKIGGHLAHIVLYEENRIFFNRGNIRIVVPQIGREYHFTSRKKRLNGAVLLF